MSIDITRRNLLQGTAAPEPAGTFLGPGTACLSKTDDGHRRSMRESRNSPRNEVVIDQRRRTCST